MNKFYKTVSAEGLVADHNDGSAGATPSTRLLVTGFFIHFEWW
jgi:hypothetical protein